mmetsp:Transcript_3158/g.8732  ORF Transcript_3158/g.8732 Transcript_3158/m.8732 type:complete len:204 (+) Transcript_3158:969-1580(+)
MANCPCHHSRNTYWPSPRRRYPLQIPCSSTSGHPDQFAGGLVSCPPHFVIRRHPAFRHYWPARHRSRHRTRRPQLHPGHCTLRSPTPCALHEHLESLGLAVLGSLAVPLDFWQEHTLLFLLCFPVSRFVNFPGHYLIAACIPQRYLLFSCSLRTEAVCQLPETNRDGTDWVPFLQNAPTLFGACRTILKLNAIYAFCGKPRKG